MSPALPTQEFTPLGPTLVFQSGGGKLCLKPFALGLEALQLGSVAVLFTGGLDLSDFQLHLLELNNQRRERVNTNKGSFNEAFQKNIRSIQC